MDQFFNGEFYKGMIMVIHGDGCRWKLEIYILQELLFYWIDFSVPVNASIDLKVQMNYAFPVCFFKAFLSCSKRYDNILNFEMKWKMKQAKIVLIVFFFQGGGILLLHILYGTSCFFFRGEILLLLILYGTSYLQSKIVVMREKLMNCIFTLVPLYAIAVFGYDLDRLQSDSSKNLL